MEKRLVGEGSGSLVVGALVVVAKSPPHETLLSERSGGVAEEKEQQLD